MFLFTAERDYAPIFISDSNVPYDRERLVYNGYFDNGQTLSSSGLPLPKTKFIPPHPVAGVVLPESMPSSPSPPPPQPVANHPEPLPVTPPTAEPALKRISLKEWTAREQSKKLEAAAALINSTTPEVMIEKIAISG